MSGAAVRECDPEAETSASVSVVIPCLDEASSIEACVHAARAAIDEGGYRGEVIVVDNGSTDGSALATPPARALWRSRGEATGTPISLGWRRLRGKYIVMLDADL